MSDRFARSSSRVSVRVPHSVSQRLDDLASRTGMSRSDVARLVLARADTVIPDELFAMADDVVRPALSASAV